MMTRKDFEQIAREYGWAFHIHELRFDPSTGNVVNAKVERSADVGRTEDFLRGYREGWEMSLRTLRIACQDNNERFDSERFMKAVNNFADLADKIGNRIFEQ